MSDSKRESQSSTENKDNDKTIQKFLEHVVKGEEKEMEEMLKADPSLAFKKGKVTDYSGRQFIGIGDDREGISGFQYAIWARDTDIWLDLLPQIKDSKNISIDSIDIDAVPEIAKQQLKEVNEVGLTYIPPQPVSEEERERLKMEMENENEKERKKIKETMAAEKKGDPFFDTPNPMSIVLSYHSANTKTEKEYDFQITKALESFVAYIDNIYKKYGDDWDKLRKHDWKEVDEIWIHTVGGAQRLVPVHVANQYCRTDSSFKPYPKFNSSDAKLSLKGRRTVKLTDRIWYPLEGQKADSRLGVQFGIVKGEGQGRAWVWGHFGRVLVGRSWLLGDLAAMTALCKVKQQDLETLTERLLSPRKSLKA